MSTPFFLLLIALLTKHLIVDFPLQAFPYQYKNKGTYGHPGGLLHAGLHLLGTFLVLVFFVSPIIAIILVVLYFVSGADAGSIVMGTISENGTIKPRRWTVIFWGAATGAVASVMLVIGGSDALDGLQSIIIMAAFPFLFVMIAMAVALTRDLYTDPMIVRQRYARTAVEAAIVEGVTQHGDDFALAVAQTPPGAGVGSLIDDADKTGEIPAVRTGNIPAVRSGTIPAVEDKSDQT